MRRSAPGKLEDVNGPHDGMGAKAMRGKEVTHPNTDFQQCIERLRERRAAQLHASRDAVRLTEDGWFCRKGGEWQRVPWELYTVNQAVMGRKG
jgi:hypothetical protein